MGIVRFHVGTTLDHYLAGPNQTREEPLGDGIEGIHDWMFTTSFWQEMVGGTGGETGPNDAVLREAAANLGASIMGHNMFGHGKGDGDLDWKGWWGDNPPYHHPVFVLSHTAREPVVMDGGTTFHFVTDGIESALAQARAAAGDKDIRINGGAETINQYLAAGHIDEFELHIFPRILGLPGARVCEGVNVNLELLRTVDGGQVTHLKYRVVK